LTKIKKFLWMTLGLFCVGMAYIGFVLPGIPFSIFLVIAAYSFAKSNERLHKWIYNHPHFGAFLTNWAEKRVFPLRAKYLMLFVMSTTLIFTWFLTGNVKAVVFSGTFMTLVAVWAWRFPSSIEDYNRRKQEGKRIGWIR